MGHLSGARVLLVAVDRDDRVLVLQGRPPAIEVFDRDGSHLETWGGLDLVDAASISAGATGRVLVSDRERTGFWCSVPAESSSSCSAPRAGRDSTARSTTRPLPPSGRMVETIVADGARGASIHRFDESGQLLRTWGRLGSRVGELVAPVALAVDATGRVLVVDHGADRVEIFTADGDHLGSWTDFWRPMAVWVEGTVRST